MPERRAIVKAPEVAAQKKEYPWLKPLQDLPNKYANVIAVDDHNLLATVFVGLTPRYGKFWERVYVPWFDLAEISAAFGYNINKLRQGDAAMMIDNITHFMES